LRHSRIRDAPRSGSQEGCSLSFGKREPAYPLAPCPLWTSTGGLAGRRQTALSVRGFGSVHREAETWPRGASSRTGRTSPSAGPSRSLVASNDAAPRRPTQASRAAERRCSLAARMEQSCRSAVHGQWPSTIGGSRLRTVPRCAGHRRLMTSVRAVFESGLASAGLLRALCRGCWSSLGV
jgi:hypothetical protein